MNKRFKEAAKDYLFFMGLAPGGECEEAYMAGAQLGYAELQTDLLQTFSDMALKSHDQGYAEGRRDMNEECAQLACAYSIGLDGLTEEIRALVADEEKSNG